MEPSEVNSIMNQLYISYAVQKYIDSIKRSKEDIARVKTEAQNDAMDEQIDKGIDKANRISLHAVKVASNADPFAQKKDNMNEFYREEMENLEWDEIFLDLL